VALPFFAWIFMRGRAESHDEYVARQFARHTGLSSESLLALMRTNDRLRHHAATDGDWKSIEEFAASPHIEYRVNAELALTYAKGTKFEEKARGLLRRLAQDPDGGTRVIALRSLKAMRDPDASRLLQTAMASNDPYVSAKAHDISRQD